MGYHKFEEGDLVAMDKQPYIIYSIRHTEKGGRVYGLLRSNKKFDYEQLEFVPRESFTMWRHTFKVED